METLSFIVHSFGDKSPHTKLKIVHDMYRYVLGHKEWIANHPDILEILLRKLDEFENGPVHISHRMAQKYRKELLKTCTDDS